jgi:hypothetical protein
MVFAGRVDSIRRNVSEKGVDKSALFDVRRAGGNVFRLCCPRICMQPVDHSVLERKFFAISCAFSNLSLTIKVLMIATPAKASAANFNPDAPTSFGARKFPARKIHIGLSCAAPSRDALARGVDERLTHHTSHFNQSNGQW